MTTPRDELGGALVAARLVALGRLAPRRHRMAAAGSAALAAAKRMVDRVHGDAAYRRHAALPAIAPCLADVDVGVVGVGNRTDSRKAVLVHEPLLAGIEPEQRITLVAADILGIGAGRARDLAAGAGLHLDIVDDRADRHGDERHGIAGLHVRLARSHHRGADRKALRRQDIAELAILVFDQRDESRAVGIVFQTLDGSRHAKLPPLEIDDPVRPLVATATPADGDAAGIVAPAGRRLALDQALDRLALVELRSVDEDELALARRGRVVGTAG